MQIYESSKNLQPNTNISKYKQKKIQRQKGIQTEGRQTDKKTDIPTNIETNSI